MFSKQETLDAYASIAANLDLYRARDWRPLVDTTNDPVMSARKPKAWTTWQRSEDYYNEGLLIWLEADAKLLSVMPEHDLAVLDYASQRSALQARVTAAFHEALLASERQRLARERGQGRALRPLSPQP